MNTIKTFLARHLRLFCLGIYYYLWDLFEYCRVVAKYYKTPKFAMADLGLKILYLFSNPYRLCHQYLKNHPADTVQTLYGETPLTSFDKLYHHLEIQSGETLYELGSGRGRLAIWAASVKNLNTIGIELNATFIKRARLISKICRLKNLAFEEINIIDANFKNADYLYLYGSAFSDEAKQNIANALIQTASHAKIISISEPIFSEKNTSVTFPITDQIDIEFDWGTTTAYIQSIRSL